MSRIIAIMTVTLLFTMLLPAIASELPEIPVGDVGCCSGTTPEEWYEIGEALKMEIDYFNLAFYARTDPGVSYGGYAVFYTYFFSIPIVDGEYDAALNGIITGEYRVSVQAFDDNKILLFRGESFIEVEEGAETNLVVDLAINEYYWFMLQVPELPGVFDPSGDTSIEIFYQGESYWGYGQFDDGDMVFHMYLPTEFDGEAILIVYDENGDLVSTYLNFSIFDVLEDDDGVLELPFDPVPLGDIYFLVTFEHEDLQPL